MKTVTTQDMHRTGLLPEHEGKLPAPTRHERVRLTIPAREQPPVHEGTLVRLKQRGRFGVRVAKSASPKRGDLARVTTWKGETKTVRLEDVERDGVDSITFTLPRRW